MTSPINSNVNRSSLDSLSNKSARTENKTSAADTGASTSPSAADTVSLSSQSTQVQELQSRLNDIPEVDAEKVAAIKEEIARGNYPVDSNRIAENLLNLEKALNDT